MSASQSRRRHSGQPTRFRCVTFLGTSSAQPAPLKRNVSSMVIQNTTGSLYMIDCGEATQHQFKLSTLRVAKLHSIFLTHLHGDHSYGIFGLLHSLPKGADPETATPVHIYGPIGVRSMVETVLAASGGWLNYPLVFHELQLPSQSEQDQNVCQKPSQSQNNSNINSIANASNAPNASNVSNASNGANGANDNVPDARERFDTSGGMEVDTDPETTSDTEMGSKQVTKSSQAKSALYYNFDKHTCCHATHETCDIPSFFYHTKGSQLQHVPRPDPDNVNDLNNLNNSNDSNSLRSNSSNSHNSHNSHNSQESHSSHSSHSSHHSHNSHNSQKLNGVISSGIVYNNNQLRWHPDRTYKTNEVIYLGEIEHGIDAYACPITHRVPTFGYVFVERDRPGRLDGAKAAKLGARGKDMGNLKQGMDITVTGPDGKQKIIYSKDVVGPAVKGHKIAVMQDCSDCRSCVDVAQGCDLFIHECTYSKKFEHLAHERGHSTSEMAALSAVNANAKMLVLTHFSSRYVEETDHLEMVQEKLDALEREEKTGNSGSDKELNEEGKEDLEDFLCVQELQREAEATCAKYNHKECVVRCAADFMTFARDVKMGRFVVEKQLMLKDNRKEHFTHDLQYLRMIETENAKERTSVNDSKLDRGRAKAKLSNQDETMVDID